MIKNPKNTTFHRSTKNGEIQCQLKWRTDFGMSKTKAYHKAQIFVDSEVLRLSDPLTPMRSKELIRSGMRATDVGSGLVEYRTPYARYHYYGKLMVGRAPKRLTNKSMTYQGAPQRGPKWFERMKVQHKKDILKGAGKIASK